MRSEVRMYSLSDFLVREVRKLAEQPTLEELVERLSRRTPYTGKVSPTALIREERDRR